MCGESHLNIKNLLNLTTAGHLAWEAILVPTNHKRKYPEKNKFPQVLLVGRTWCWWSCLRPACPRRRHLSPRSPASRSPSRPRTHSSRFHLQGPPAQVILHSFPPLTDGGMEKKGFTWRERAVKYDATSTAFMFMAKSISPAEQLICHAASPKIHIF